MWFVGSEKPCIYSVPNRKQSYEIEKDNNFHQTQKAYMELRYYEYKEIVTLLESVGFKIKEKYGWYDKCSLEKGHEIIIVAEK